MSGRFLREPPFLFATPQTVQETSPLVASAPLRYTFAKQKRKGDPRMTVTTSSSLRRMAFGIGLLASLAACGSSGSLGGSNPLGSIGSLGGSFGGNASTPATQQAVRTRGAESVAVNRYLWAASLDVLDFLPVQSVDPFTGVIVTGFGTPPGGSRAYRATIYITDPALDARSLNVALLTRSGPAAAETTRAIEDAILSRARQLRIADGAL